MNKVEHAVIWNGGIYVATPHPTKENYLLLRDNKGKHFDVLVAEVRETTGVMTDELDAEIREDVRILEGVWGDKNLIN